LCSFAGPSATPLSLLGDSRKIGNIDSEEFFHRTDLRTRGQPEQLAGLGQSNPRNKDFAMSLGFVHQTESESTFSFQSSEMPPMAAETSLSLRTSMTITGQQFSL
jgi:hypothetical protein